MITSPTLYLVSPRGHLSQFTKENQAQHPGSVPLGSPSDNRLTDASVDPALRCKPWTAPDLADPGSQVAALPPQRADDDAADSIQRERQTTE